MACIHYAPGSILTLTLLVFFPLKIEDLPFHEHFPAEQKCQKNLEILSKCSVEAIKNTTLCKLNKVSKGFRPMGPNADLTPEAEPS